jgi:iron(III) transport system substrate-binding protein
LAIGVAFGLAAHGSVQQVPQAYGPGYGELVAAAYKERSLAIDSTTDEDEAAGLLTSFRALYPGIQVTYAKRNSTELYDRFLEEAAAGATVDLLWSSAMDLQVKLVNDGYAQSYASPEWAALPDWAVWGDLAYGVTAEPVGIAYDKRRLAAADVPQTHADLARLLAARPGALDGRVVAYDPEHSGAGYLFLTQDVEVTDRTWDLVRAMGHAEVGLYTSTAAMLDRVVAGDATVAYDVLASYAAERAKADPSLGVVLPADYTLVVSRIAFIPRTARHPSAARLFLDHLISHKGQELLAERSLGPVRGDVRAGWVAALGGSEDALRPIRIGPELLTYLDRAKRERFLKEWRRALRGP